MKKSFWATKNVLVTGTNGFIAANLIKQLLKYNAKITGISRDKKVFSSLDSFELSDKINLVIGSITDFNLISSTINKFEIDTIFHLAASSQVAIAATSPMDTFQSNVIGTLNILEAVRLSCGRVRRMIISSSDKAYGDQRIVLPYREDYALRGIYPYDCSKSCADLIAQTYFVTYKIPLRITRCTNIYGPGDLNFQRIIPGTIFRILLNENIEIDESVLSTMREYLFINDAIEAYIKLMESIDPNDIGEDCKLETLPLEGYRAYSHCAYNIGGGIDNVKTVPEVVDAILNQIGETKNMKIIKKGKFCFGKDNVYSDLPSQYADSSKIKNEIGWTPRMKLIPNGLDRTIEWYEQNFDKIKSLSVVNFNKHKLRTTS